MAGCSARIKEVIKQLTGLHGQYCSLQGKQCSQSGWTLAGGEQHSPRMQRLTALKDNNKQDAFWFLEILIYIFKSATFYLFFWGGDFLWYFSSKAKYVSFLFTFKHSTEMFTLCEKRRCSSVGKGRRTSF